LLAEEQRFLTPFPQADKAIPLIVGGRGEAGAPLSLVFNLREQPGGDGVLILGGKLLSLGDRTLEKCCHETSNAEARPAGGLTPRFAP
jgi:hypothetical protein